MTIRYGHRDTHPNFRLIEAGEVSSLREIAKSDGADHSYVAKHINLTLLAPDIVAAILVDGLPDGVRLSALLINPPGFVGGSVGSPRCDACASSGEEGRVN